MWICVASASLLWYMVCVVVKLGELFVLMACLPFTKVVLLFRLIVCGVLTWVLLALAFVCAEFWLDLFASDACFVVAIAFFWVGLFSYACFEICWFVVRLLSDVFCFSFVVATLFVGFCVGCIDFWGWLCLGLGFWFVTILVWSFGFAVILGCCSWLLFV